MKNKIFMNTDISGDMSGETFEDCTFIRCNLTDVLLKDSTFIECDFYDSIINSVDFSNSEFFMSDFYDCYFIDVVMNDCKFEKCHGLNQFEENYMI